ncbi:YpjP family protein [Salimicrobium flavidum]|uniref:YpjP-like protein n=1 Tax=Salimicrobium flavidum TaxID=570947 RepID=A0A1N7IUY6_9BACI|nr:YpjP family protein [Salimicrobium flavidum]SIS40903.1 YpjP-like protein [Salimicrobium flavidum]
MKIWMRKLFVSLVAIMTLGLYVPPTQINPEASEKEQISGEMETVREENEPFLPPVTLEHLTERAKEQTMNKLGPRIGAKVEEEVIEEIFPEMEAVIESFVEDKDVPMYEITEDPSAGYGERIFNLIHSHTGEELARFHVRRDLRPGEGYWFNFHYHVKEDGYETHYPLGEIFWDKNTPPKWMS